MFIKIFIDILMSKIRSMFNDNSEFIESKEKYIIVINEF